MKAFLVSHQLLDDEPNLVGIVYAPSIEKAMPKIEEIARTNWEQNGDKIAYEMRSFVGRKEGHQESYYGGYPVVEHEHSEIIDEDDVVEWYNVNEVPIHVVE